MIRKLTILFVLALSVNFSRAQELNCNFSVNYSRFSGTEKDILVTLEKSVREFLNNTIWTNHVYESNERIECNFTLDVVAQNSGGEYDAKLNVQSRRPIYGTSYNSVLLNYIDDDVSFQYQEFDPIVFSENNFTENLSSVLAFYVYFILGLDYDSFSPLGGNEFFKIAEKIVYNAQGSNRDGWLSAQSRKRKNRYWLIENMLDSDYEPLRNFTYSYHRQGLDLMEKSAEQGRNNIYDAVEDLKRFHDNKPDPFVTLLQVIMESKSEEIPKVFSTATDDKKKKVYDIMMKVAPAAARKYDVLKK